VEKNQIFKTQTILCSVTVQECWILMYSFLGGILRAYVKFHEA